MNQFPEANKKLGQHFLSSQKVIEKICNDYVDQADVVIEVGPGPGILTEKLSKLNIPLFLIEKDKRFEDKLKTLVPEDHIFIQDALRFSWKKLFRVFKLEDKRIWLVSNLPYNVGTILFTNFLEIPEIKYMTLMFQKEVGQKTFVRDEKNQMNGLLFLSTNYFESNQLIKVSPGCFTPPPKVDSVVVSYTRIQDPNIVISDFGKLNSFLRVLFGMKRKQIQKVLKSQYHQDEILPALEAANIKPSDRAESLSLDQVRSLFTELNNKKT